jgi:hypothetical protein
MLSSLAHGNPANLHRHHFDEDKLEWIPVPKKIDPKKDAENKKAEEEKKKKEEEDKKRTEAIKKQAEDAKKAEEQKKAAEKSEPMPPPPQRGETANAPPSVPGSGQAQGEDSHPPVSKKPSPPAVQRDAEEKVIKADEKRDEAVKQAEEKRRAEEEKAVKAEEKRKVDEEAAKPAP